MTRTVSATITSAVGQDVTQPVYLILSVENLERLQSNTDIKPHVLFRLEGFHETPADELVVIK